MRQLVDPAADMNWRDEEFSVATAWLYFDSDGALAALDRMDALIEDMLVLAQEGQAGDETGPVSVSSVVDMAFRSADSDAVTVEADPELGAIVGRESSVRTLIVNLFRNAIEHGDPDVTIHVTMLDDGFAVEDNGPGIPEAERDDVFERGIQRKRRGLGSG